MIADACAVAVACVRIVANGVARIAARCADRCVCVPATRQRIAEVERTFVHVVAIGCWAAVANTPAARIQGSARVAVVTRQGVVGVDAAQNHVARVGCADVAVITIRRGTAVARSTAAHVHRRTGIAVATWIGVVVVETAASRMTSIIGAAVAVIAVRSGTTCTHTGDAHITQCAGAAVIAGIHVVHVLAAQDRVT